VVPLPPMCHQSAPHTESQLPAPRPRTEPIFIHSVRTVETMAVIYHRSRPRSPRARFAGGSTEGSIGGAAETATACMPTYTMPASLVLLPPRAPRARNHRVSHQWLVDRMLKPDPITPPITQRPRCNEHRSCSATP
jgi:hypothetical protein